MRIKALRSFISTRFGNVVVGQELDVADRGGQTLIGAGLARLCEVEKYETKVVERSPLPGGEKLPETTGEPSSLSPAAPALPEPTVRRRGKKEKSKSSL